MSTYRKKTVVVFCSVFIPVVLMALEVLFSAGQVEAAD